MFKRIAVVVNPAAGRPEPLLYTVNKVFSSHGIDWDIFVTKKPGDAKRFAQKAVRYGYEAVAVYGGDGTIMEAANGLMGTPTPLALLPGGTANILAIELGIPVDLIQACALIANDEVKVRAIDIGSMGKRFFILRIGFGFEAEMVKGAHRDMKNKVGTLAYWISAIQAIRGSKTVKYDIIVDGKEIKTEGLTCIIANSGNMGLPGFILDKKIEVTDGLLDVVVIKSANLSSLVSVAAGIIEGNENASLLLHWQGKSIEVTASPAQDIQCDGELLKRKTVQVQVVPQAFSVIVPDA